MVIKNANVVITGPSEVGEIGYYTPVTKGLLGSLVLSSVAVHFPLQAYKPYFFYTYATIFEKYEIWRFLLCRTTFLDPKDALCAALLLYHFRIFERRYGSLKYASVLLGTFVLSSCFELAVIYLSHQAEWDLTPFPAGPFGPVFATFVPYFCDIPRVAITHLMGIPVTGKSLTYIMGLQLIGTMESNLLAICGLVAGILYRYNFLFIKSLTQLPRFVGQAFSTTLGRVLHTPPPSDLNRMVGATLELQRQQHIEALEQQMAWAQLQHQPRNRNAFGMGLFGNRNGGRPPEVNNPPEPAVPPPSEEQVQQLIEMGFTRDNVLNALQACNNDINSATDILLHQQTL